jgi:S1-C subfamily serine protease
VLVNRNGKNLPLMVTLRNKAGNFEIVRNDTKVDKLGADFMALDPKKAKEYGIEGGIVVKKINSGAIYDQTRMKDGFVILKVNDKDVKTVDDLRKAVGQENNVTITGFYPGYEGLYEYPITLE